MVVGDMVEKRQLIVVGGGPGGYTTAIRAAQLGSKVTLIEKDKLGGLCLQEGCIPSKVYAHAAAQQANMKHLAQLGFSWSAMTFELAELYAYRNKTVQQLQKGVEGLCKAYGIEVLYGEAIFTAANRIGVENGHKFDLYEFENAVIATGSTAKAQAVFANHKAIVVGGALYKLDHLPQSIIIYGDDIYALEAAFTYANLGVAITILTTSTELPYDEMIAKELERQCKKQKIQLQKSVTITQVEDDEQGITICYSNLKNESASISAQYLYTTGETQANTTNLTIERFATSDDKGFLVVDEALRTSQKNIYAIGDVTAKRPSAIRAIKEGKLVAAILAGQSGEIDDLFVPLVAHTLPPFVSVGLTTEALKERSQYKVATYPLRSNGAATIKGQGDGSIKIIAEKASNIVVGIHMIGGSAIELSASFVQMLEMVARDEDFIFPSYAHPSIQESLLEAAEQLQQLAIHVPPSKK